LAGTPQRLEDNLVTLRLKQQDLWAAAFLVGVWLLFFWRALPVHEDALRPAPGDFYGQFYAFSVYQYERMTQGALPLWNPYNHGGFPFAADPQTAVFYPPRLMMIGAAYLLGGWSVDALLIEGLLHFLIASAGWYSFLRLLTCGRVGSTSAALTGTLIACYGGFLTGYPLLQLAILEGAAWLPFMLTALRLSLRDVRLDTAWLGAASAFLAVSWLAGHSQTAWFCSVLGAAYLVYLCWQQRLRFMTGLLALLSFAALTFAASAAAILPGLEYLRTTTRADMDFAQKANGFPLRDVVQILVPGVVSQFSPLFISVTGFSLALHALRDRASWFWGGVALAALLLSFGGNAPFYGLLYPLPTGLSFFRGQERFAFLVNAGLSVMAAYGVTLALDDGQRRFLRRYVRAWVVGVSLLYLALLAGASAGLISNEALPSVLLSTVACFAIWASARRSYLFQAPSILPLMVGLELFRLSISSSAVFVPREQVEPLQPAANLISIVQADPTIFRVDGFRGLHDHFASVEQLQDIRGISPLFITTVERIVNRNYSHNPLAWELFAVKYVFSDRQRFSTPTTLLGEGVDRSGPIVLHQLDNPRPFAHWIYHADSVDSDEFAWALLNDPRYQPRESIILLGELSQPLPASPVRTARAEITSFAPEAITIEVETPENAILSLAWVDYPGWTASLDQNPLPIRRAYGALMAFEIPPGQHTLELTYRPLSVMIGIAVSAAAWTALLVWPLVRRFRTAA
jgi:hypothetical protein